MALPADIIRTIKDLSRRVTNLETTPQPPNIGLSDLVSASFGMNDGVNVLITVRLWNDPNRLLAMPAFALFKDSVSDANLFTSGANWTNNERNNLRMTSWIDWGQSDNNDVVFKILLVNNTGTNYATLLFRGNFRFLQREAST